MEYTMVIADDEPLVCKSEELLIQQEFPEIRLVGTANDGIELKEMLEQLQPDMAIVDVRMPGLTGIEVIAQERRRGCQTHFLINTAYSDFDYVKQALDLKTDGYLLKPGKREDTVRAIRELLETVQEKKKENQKQQRIDSAMGRASSVLGNEVLLSIFSDQCDEEGFRAFCDMRAISFSCGCIATFLPGTQTEISARETRAALEKTLDALCTYLMTVSENGMIVMFILPGEMEKKQQVSCSRSWAKQAATCLGEQTGTAFRYGVGGLYDSFPDMQKSYQDSIRDLGLHAQKTEEENQDAATYVARAQKYVTDHFREDISLQDCAEKAGISPYYLSHIFKEQTGQTFVAYLSKLRIEEAKRLCGNRDLTVKDLAEQCGYPNESYFCKVFKRTTGLTISEYRHQEE